MKILMWNVRGANSSDFLSHACDVLRAHNPVIFVIVETKSDEVRVNQVCGMLGFDDFKAVGPLGKKGGIWLFRRKSVELMYYSEGTPNYFHAVFNLILKVQRC